MRRFLIIPLAAAVFALAGCKDGSTPLDEALDLVIPVACVDQRIARVDLLIDALDRRANQGGALEMSAASTVAKLETVLRRGDASSIEVGMVQASLLTIAGPSLYTVAGEYVENVQALPPMQVALIVLQNLTRSGIDTVAIRAGVRATRCQADK